MPGVSCPEFGPANDAGGFVSIVTLVAVVVLALLGRALRAAWAARVRRDGEAYSLPASWTLVVFATWFVATAGTAVAAMFSADRPESAGPPPAKPGTGSIFVVLALSVVAAYLWWSWRSHRTYVWANRQVTGGPFKQAPPAPLPHFVRGPTEDSMSDGWWIRCETCGAEEYFDEYHDAEAEKRRHVEASQAG